MQSKLASIVGVLSLTTAGACFAQANTAGAYPLKPLRFLVGVAPGGGTDFAARLVGARLAEKFGQPVIIDKLSSAIAEVVAEPDVVQKLVAQGGGAAGSSPKVFAEFLNAETTRWITLAKEVGITVD